MNPYNTELLQKLALTSKNLCFCRETDSDVKPFIWEIALKGDLTLEKLLESEGFLFPVKTSELLDFISLETSWPMYARLTPIETASLMNLKYKELIDFLSSHLKTLEIYIVSNLGYGNSDKRKEKFKKSRIGNPDLYFLSVNQLNAPYKIGQICIEQEAFHIIVGETFEGDWIGIAPELFGETNKKGKQLLPFPEESKNDNTIALKNQIETLVQELEFSVVHCLAFDRKEKAIVETSYPLSKLG
ncbi:MAG: nuclease A inhibitor family protein [Nostoc sp.]|uniref:nuclease A inhibitor family protein n=1 Tax=Nostoc sp. TaxID=1180 RepID=UPI002FF89122